MGYKIIKHCRACGKRFVVMNGNSKKNYCDECMRKYEKSHQIE